MNKHFLFFFIFSHLTFLFDLPAATIKTKDGSVFRGEILHQDEGHLTLKTKYAGTIMIEQIAIIKEQAKAKAKKKEKSPWSSHHFLNLNAQRGNRVTNSSSIGTRLHYKDQYWKGKIYGRYYNQETRIDDQRNNSDEESIGGFDIDRRLGKKNSIYLRSELEKDTRERLLWRNTNAAGLSYYWFDDKKLTVRFRLGYFSRQESYLNRDDKDLRSGMDSSILHKWTIWEELRITNSVIYTPDFDKAKEKYHLNHESFLSYPLGKKKHWSLQIGMRNNYNNTPFSAEQEQLDSYYYSRLSLSFK